MGKSPDFAVLQQPAVLEHALPAIARSYVARLESNVGRLRKENRELKDELRALRNEVRRLNDVARSEATEPRHDPRRWLEMLEKLEGEATRLRAEVKTLRDENSLLFSLLEDAEANR